MTEPLDTFRPVPRWLHMGAILAAASTLLLLVLGQLVTSFRAGMADPIWPTEPWYLFSNYKLDFGYLVEHTHRIAAFTVGGLVIFLVLGLWWTEPRQTARWIAIVGVLVLIAGFGEFHRGLMAQRNVSPTEVRIPLISVIVTAIGFLIVFGVAISQMLLGVGGASLRILGSTALVAVMIQGLLGGFRVKLNELVGTDLAALHGIFAQVVLSLLVLLAVLTEEPLTPSSLQSVAPSRLLGRWSIGLTALLFVQIVWGAIIRHNPTPLTQRLHFLTAFLALAVAVLILRAVFTDPSASIRVGVIGWVLSGLLIAQLCLGVEAWMMKFGTYTLPELVPITLENATIRTLHALIGSGILISALALAVRLMRTSKSETRTPSTNNIDWTEQTVAQGRALEIAARFGGNAP